MAEPAGYAYTVLSDDATLELEIDGEKFNVVQFTMSFCKNGIPEATCLVAIGRDAHDQKTQAKIHDMGPQLLEMKEAKVRFSPRGDWKPGGPDWHSAPQVIFDGYYVGLAYRKVSNKVHAVIHLAHFCIDLAFSSTLHRWQHPTNPTNYVFPAITPGFGTGHEQDKCFVSCLCGYGIVYDKVQQDVWKAIKQLFCEIASNDQRFEIGCGSAQGTGDESSNDRALKALKRFEVDADNCNFTPANGETAALFGASRTLRPEVFSKPLIVEAVAKGICQQTVQTFAAHTFWDILVAKYCQDFGMAVIPLSNRCLVSADAPYWRADQQPWKEIYPEEYEHLNLSGRIAQPVQAVGVIADHDTLTKLAYTEEPDNDKICLGGHKYADVEDPVDGSWLIVQAPVWLKLQHSVGEYGQVMGVKKQDPNKTQTTPEADPDPPEDPPVGEKSIVENRNNVFTAYAWEVLVKHHLRHRAAQIDGKLRFDIGPGSLVKLMQEPRDGAEGTDELAVPLWAQVQRVTVNINAEGRRAGTSFDFTHVRTEKENTDNDRTSADKHPLFGTNIFKGAPLVEAWEDLDV